MRSITDILGELNKTILNEIAALEKRKQELLTITAKNTELLKNAQELKAAIDEDARRIEKEKVIDRQRKAALDVREGKIQAIEERLRGL